MNDDVRDVIASLREGDEVEADFDSDRGPYMIRGAVFGNPKSVGPKWLHHATAIRVIKRAPLPEPPAGTPVWWDGKWWVRDEAGAAYTSTLWAERDTVKFWQFMPGAVPAATPGGDDE